MNETIMDDTENFEDINMVIDEVNVDDLKKQLETKAADLDKAVEYINLIESKYGKLFEAYSTLLDLYLGNKR